MIMKRIVSFFILCLSLTTLTFAANSTVHHLLQNKNDPVSGNPKGKITVVEFFDYQCSHCIKNAPVTQAILKANPDIRYVFKDLPIQGSNSEFAAKAALAANKQGKYAELNHALLNANQALSEEVILTLAQSVGLNMDQLKKDMRSKAIAKQIDATLALAKSLRIEGTPAFYVAKSDAQSMDQVQFILGELSESDMQAAINRQKS